MESMRHKDEILYELGTHVNVAQFVSYGPGAIPGYRFSRIQGYDQLDASIELTAAIRLLMHVSPERRLNVRSFRPEQTKGGEFLYGLSNDFEVVEHVRRLTGSGWYVIVNETIDVNDGGVSGVMLGPVIEFAPGDTPRCVEKPGACRLPRAIGLQMLKTVYGFDTDLDNQSTARVEFSIHPIRRGHQHDHAIIWELEKGFVIPQPPIPSWPNRFSKFIGDKVFGLLLANSLIHYVPRTTAITRNTVPFSFGVSTGTGEYWQRTAPSVQTPGKMPTTFGWRDPFVLFQDLVRSGDSQDCAAILCQEGVDSKYSGAAACTQDGGQIIEGIEGKGVGFMLGERRPQFLPQRIISDVRQVLEQLERELGPIRIEWAHDGSCIWVLQLHTGSISADKSVICEGDAERWIRFETTQGLEALRNLIKTRQAENIGIELIGDVGVTSHFGDLLRGRAIPSILRQS